jgi:group II intron reverse transcriptase/maturase/CRISPR-associated endonuclease Cas1
MAHIDPASSSLFDSLLPLFGLQVTLQFTAPAEFTLFHQMTIDAFNRNVLQSPENFKEGYTTEAPESGRLHYTHADKYHYQIISLGQPIAPFDRLIQTLKGLPNTAPIKDPAAPLRNNIQLSELSDFIKSTPINKTTQLTPFSGKQLNAISEHWQNAHTQYPRTLHIQWASPVRLLRANHERNQLNLKGDRRFCRDKTHLTAELLIQRITDSLASLCEQMGKPIATYQKPAVPSHLMRIKDADLFWVDTPYYSKDAKDNTAGGMIGSLVLEQSGPLPDWIIHALILGQFIGVGQRRTSGFGKYHLTIPSLAQAPSHPKRPKRHESLLSRALRLSNIQSATRFVEKASGQNFLAQKYQTQLENGIRQLQTNSYQAPALFGQTIPKRNGQTRFLAVAPLHDRILQKAIALELTPTIDAILAQRSFAYRKGKSRLQVRDEIQKKINQGYTWIYESDIKGFFDSIDRHQLTQRLQALIGPDPITNAVFNWLSADVIIDGKRQSRPQGIPQGSALSPLLANFILDDFDADLEEKGFHLIRFADDFIVMCQSEIQAELAAFEVTRSLSEIGLKINPEKSHILTTQQGFKFVGYMFQEGFSLDLAHPKNAAHPLSSSLESTEDEWEEESEEFSDFQQAAQAYESGQTNEHINHQDSTLEIERQSHQTFPAEQQIDQTTPPWDTIVVQSPEETESPQLSEPLQTFGQMPTEGIFFTLAGESSLLTLENGQLVIKQDEIIIQKTPIIHLSGILLFGNHHLTTPLMKACLNAHIPVHLASRMGQYEGALWKNKPIDNSYKGWLNQIAHFDDPEKTLPLAQATVKSRINNLKYLLKRYTTNEPIAQHLERIKGLERKLHQTENLQSLLGYEGAATREYYQALTHIVPRWCEFDSRNRRPPKDPFNVLLSYGYTWLYAHTDAILTAQGFLTWKGYYHQPSAGHAALASDVIESYRHLIERVALTCVNNNILKIEDFRIENEQLRLSSEGRKRYLRELENYFLREKNNNILWQSIHNQAKSLANHIQSAETYTPFMES